MKQYNAAILVVALAMAFSLSLTQLAFSNVAVTKATGGTNISADKAANAASPAYTTLGTISIASQSSNDFPQNWYNATITLTAPAGWAFKANTGSGSVSGERMYYVGMTVSASTIVLQYSRSNHTSSTAAISISGIQVRAIDGSVLPDSGKIVKSASSQTIAGLPNGTVVGIVTQAPGAEARLAITAPPSTAVPAPAALTAQPTVVIQDQFSNTTPSSSVVTASDLGGAVLQGTVSAHAVNGVASFSDLAYAAGGTYTIRFTLGGAITATSAPFVVPVPLPVELSSFTAVVRNGGVALNWVTATETNNAGFDIQRKSGSSPWASLGFVDGNGSSNVQHAYAYKDAAVAGGTSTYRLKQIDRDGTFVYSKEVEAVVAMTAGDFTITQNYPNPFNPTTNIRFAVPTAQHVSLKVFNVLGQQVAELYDGIAEAGVMHAVQFDATGLASGTYMYQVKTAEKTEVRRMLLVR